MYALNSRVGLVTGGGGIGRAIARRLISGQHLQACADEMA